MGQIYDPTHVLYMLIIMKVMDSLTANETIHDPHVASSVDIIEVE